MRWTGSITTFDEEEEIGTIGVWTVKTRYNSERIKREVVFSSRTTLNFDARRITKGLRAEFTPNFDDPDIEAADVVIFYRAELYSPLNWEDIEEAVEGRQSVIDPIGSKSDERTYSPLQFVDSEQIALSLFENRIKLVSLRQDGKYQFLDESHLRHRIVYPSFLEEISTQIAIEEFEFLINSTMSKEDDFQEFFERNKDFILNDDYKDAHPHVVLTKLNDKTLIPDFILEPVGQESFCDLLELKLPKTEIFVLKKNRPRYSAAIFDAVAQLKEYGKYFDDESHRSNFHRVYPHLHVYKPRMFVIIGRQDNHEPLIKREIQSEFPQLYLKTYDELLARMKWKRDKMSAKNKLF